MVKVIMNGATGKMGQVITRLVGEMEEVSIVAGVDINDSVVNPYPVYRDIFEVREPADVIIDFSHPSCLEPLLSYACEKELPVVVATTGLSENQKEMIRTAAGKTAAGSLLWELRSRSQPKWRNWQFAAEKNNLWNIPVPAAHLSARQAILPEH